MTTFLCGGCALDGGFLAFVAIGAVVVLAGRVIARALESRRP